VREGVAHRHRALGIDERDARSVELADPHPRQTDVAWIGSVTGTLLLVELQQGHRRDRFVIE